MELPKVLGPALRRPFRGPRNLQNYPNPSSSNLCTLTTKCPFNASRQPSSFLLSLARRPHDHSSSAPRRSVAYRSLTTTSTINATSSMSGLSTLGAALGARQAENTRALDSRLQADAKHPQERQPWHLHCYATKHNTHLTLTRPNRDAVISISTGQIGFKKAARGSYDAAYQLGAYMMARIQRAGLLQNQGIDEIELVFRGHGSGREAISKILTGTEGAMIRHRIKSVTDSTRLKFGGTRSPKRRRLG